MSAGIFTIIGYEGDYGDGTAVHPIKVQPETLGLVIGGVTNAGTAVSNINNPISAQVSGSRRSLGLHPRMVSFEFTATPPATYAANQTLRLPLLTKDMKDVAVLGATGTYQGVAIRVVSNYAPEIVR